MNKISEKIKYMLKPKLKVNDLYFGDLVFVLDCKVSSDGFRYIKETHLIKEDVLYARGSDCYCLDIHETLPYLGQGFLIHNGCEAIKDYDIPFRKFVDQDKILKEDLPDKINEIKNSEKYKELKKLYKLAYKNTGFDV